MQKESDDFFRQCYQYIGIIIDCIRSKGSIKSDDLDCKFGIYGSIYQPINSCPKKYLNLHVFLYGLCFEYLWGRKGCYALYESLSNYRKEHDERTKVSTSHGFSCLFPTKLNEESFIEIALFAMETYGDTYSYEILTQ